jgi:N-acetylglucosamine malate deacetylase 1
MNVLVVAAHPDDEVLGCAGTIARHASSGDDVHVLIVAEGATSRDDARDAGARAEELASLQHAATAASRVLGTKPPVFGGFPDNRLDEVALLDVVKLIESHVAAAQPRVVYTHHGGDLNIDHEIVHRAVLTATRPTPETMVREVYAFETPSSTHWGSASLSAPFAPTRVVDIGAQLDAKRAALECYAAELRAFPHARSIEAVLALAQVRGSTAGVAAAEAFEVLRQLVD